MHGGQVARALRNVPGLEQTTLVAVSGAQRDDPRLAEHLPAFDHYVSKPIDFGLLDRILAAS
jgi:hypothetical protein